jgi:tetratricopeptide (TPR) repeat protein
VLLAGYVLPLYFPPGPAPIVPLPADAGLLARLFPYVPGWWVALRLAALGVGAVLLAWAGRDAGVVTGTDTRSTLEPGCPQPGRALGDDRREGTPAPDYGRRRSPWYEVAALALAISLVAFATQVANFPRWAQALLVAALAGPAIVLRIAESRPSDRCTGGDLRWWLAVALLVAGWLVWRVGFARHDPRAADFVDVWKNFGFFVEAANTPLNFVTQQSELAALSNLYMLAMGLPFVGPGKFEPGFAWVQNAHAFWIALTAWGVAALARRIAGPAAMVPAVAALLFSPFMLSMAVCVGPFALMTALAAGLLLLVWRIYERQSGADVAALGALAGLSATFPHVALWGAAAALAVLPWLIRRRPSWLVWATAALTGIAALVPVLPNLRNVSGFSTLYVERRGVAAELEQLIMGQKYFPHRDVEGLWHAGIRGPLDVPLATVLQPVAVPRTPVRLSGDVYFEPVSAALAVVGVAACLVLARRSVAARALLVALALAMLPGAIASATDRASLTRNLVTPMLLPLFTVAGVRVAQRALDPRLSMRSLAFGLAAVIAVSGVAIFDLVNPRIVATTWLSLALRAVERTPAEQVVVLEHGNPRNDWLHVPQIAGFLPPAPLRVQAYRNGGSLLALPDTDDPAAPLILWSPGLEEQAAVQSSLCGCWPEATIYTLRDAAGLSRAFAARLRDDGWEPALPRQQWSASRCAGGSPARSSCALLRAMAHDNLGQQLAAQHNLDQAIAHYRAALALRPDYATAHNSLGLALATQGNADEAMVHFREALRLDPELAPAHNNMAIALEGVGRTDEALVHYREAVRIAPADPLGRLNLGAVLAGSGRPEEAVAQFREVVRQSPGLPEGHLALADALAQQGRAREAIAEYRAALRERPDWPVASDRLAWILATTADPELRDPADAVTLATVAVQRGGDADPVRLRTLAAAQAAAGQRDEAVATAERALALARASGQEQLARDLSERLARYRAGD